MQSLNERPVGVLPTPYEIASLSDRGIGADRTLEIFEQKYGDGITASSGSRYFGFVIGGNTPAVIAGDWLVSIFDQNVFGAEDTAI